MSAGNRIGSGASTTRARGLWVRGEVCTGQRVAGIVQGSAPIAEGPPGAVWHKALVVGSVSLWRRLLASRP